MDSTVSTRAVVESLYRYLPDNGSELVVFDINRAADLRVLFRPALYAAVNTLLPPAPRAYTTTVVTNATAHTLQTVARTTLARGTGRASLSFTPASAGGYVLFVACGGAVSLSDSLYGREPDEKNRYGISLGTISLRGETGTLSVGLETLMRVTSNPFFPWMMTRVDERIRLRRTGGGGGLPESADQSRGIKTGSGAERYAAGYRRSPREPRSGTGGQTVS